MARKGAMWRGAVCGLCGKGIPKDEFPRIWKNGRHPEYVHEDCAAWFEGLFLSARLAELAEPAERGEGRGMTDLGTENFDTGEVCLGCSAPIYDDEAYLVSPDGYAYHADCAPDGSEDWERRGDG